MPMPVSSTSKRTSSVVALVLLERGARIDTVPCSVNFTALPA
jgi:hypothetical protein